jgi:hypothetical protein
MTNQKLQETETEFDLVMIHLVSDENIDFWFGLALGWVVRMKRIEESLDWA